MKSILASIATLVLFATMTFASPGKSDCCPSGECCKSRDCCKKHNKAKSDCCPNGECCKAGDCCDKKH
jgi:hypothetical protein